MTVNGKDGSVANCFISWEGFCLFVCINLSWFIIDTLSPMVLAATDWKIRIIYLIPVRKFLLLHYLFYVCANSYVFLTMKPTSTYTWHLRKCMYIVKSGTTVDSCEYALWSHEFVGWFCAANALHIKSRREMVLYFNLVTETYEIPDIKT